MTDRSCVETGSRTEPDAPVVKPQLSDEQWSLIADLFSNPEPDQRGGSPRAISSAGSSRREFVRWIGKRTSRYPSPSPFEKRGFKSHNLGSEPGQSWW